MTSRRLVEHFFRHEYGRLVAVLSRQVGVHNIEIVEDAAQFALMRALEVWTASGLPDTPSAWLFRVARNKLLGELRQESNRRQLLSESSDRLETSDVSMPDEWRAEDVSDDLLRMLFVCCDEAIPMESQLVLALKVLCGFSVREISLRLFATEANIYKRLGRARKKLRERTGLDVDLGRREVALRISAVNKILYLLFTEGYLSSGSDLAIRRELCEEAIRLTGLLVEHPIGDNPETHALFALMHLHLARMNARQNGSGGLLLLEEQDRKLWDQEGIQTGLAWLARSARGDHFTRYHAEAGIAAEHCMAPSFEETKWDRVAANYLLLEQIAPSPIHTMNRAVAVAECDGPAAGLDVLKRLEAPAWLTQSYLWSAVQSDLNRRCGNTKAANDFCAEALEAAPNEAVRELLRRRLKHQ